MKSDAGPYVLPGTFEEKVINQELTLELVTIGGTPSRHKVGIAHAQGSQPLASNHESDRL